MIQQLFLCETFPEQSSSLHNTYDRALILLPLWPDTTTHQLISYFPFQAGNIELSSNKRDLNTYILPTPFLWSRLSCLPLLQPFQQNSSCSRCAVPALIQALASMWQQFKDDFTQPLFYSCLPGSLLNHCFFAPPLTLLFPHWQYLSKESLQDTPARSGFLSGYPFICTSNPWMSL